MQIILTADEQLYDYFYGKMYAAGKVPKDTVLSVRKMSEFYQIAGEEDWKKVSVYRIEQTVPGVAEKGYFLRQSLLTSKVYEPPKVGDKMPTQKVYAVKDGVTIHVSADAKSKVLKKLKKGAAVLANRIAGTDWFALADGSGFVAFGEGKNLTSAAPVAPPKPKPSKPSYAATPATTPAAPAAPTPAIPEPSQAGMSTTTMIAIGMVALAAVVLLLPKGK